MASLSEVGAKRQRVSECVLHANVCGTTRQLYANSMKRIVKFCVKSGMTDIINAEGTALLYPVAKSDLELIFDGIGGQQGRMAANSQSRSGDICSGNDSITNSCDSDSRESTENGTSSSDDGNSAGDDIQLPNRTVNRDTIRSGAVLSVSAMNQYISAIKFYHKEEASVDSAKELSSDANSFLNDFLAGWKRIVADKRNCGEMKMHEGKTPLEFASYSKLCEAALFAAEERSVGSHYLHLFVVLCWNLFARSCSVANIRTGHFMWKNDCLVVNILVTKSDQTGEHSTPKHIFANPGQPKICPVLALALHTFSAQRHHDKEDRVFTGTPYDVISKWLNSVGSKLVTITDPECDLGTHSFRKGATTHSIGCTNAPQWTTVFLRAGWSLGAVQDRYICSNAAGDQHLGRIACGLPHNPSFAVLPPHFKKDFTISLDQWINYLPHVENLPDGFRKCLPFLLASIVYHWEWISEKDNEGKNNILYLLCT